MNESPSISCIAVCMSGHGFGHATRSSPLIEFLLSRKVRVIAVTQAPEFLFKPLISQYPNLLSYRSCPTDAGAIQRDAVSVDAEASLERLEKLMSNVEEIITNEVEFYKTNGVELIVADAGFIPMVIGAKMGIPRVIASNFTWDAIYEPFVTNKSQRELVQRVKEMYAQATHIIAYPGEIDFPFYDKTTMNYIEAPLVSRKMTPNRSPILLRAQYNIPRSQKVLLVTFGGQNLDDIDWNNVADRLLPEGWSAVLVIPKLPGMSALELKNGGKLVFLQQSPCLYIPDFIAMADMVMTKLGYGTCSEALACSESRTPIVYVPRKGFVEEPGLLRMMEDYGWVKEMTSEQFMSGTWAKCVQELWGTYTREVDTVSKKTIPPNAGELMADLVLSCRLLSN